MILCGSCEAAQPFVGCDDCLECVADALIADPAELASLRRIHAGTQWIAEVDRAIDKELGRQVAAGKQVAA